MLQVSGTTETLYVSSNLFYDCRLFKRNLPRPSYAITEVKRHGLVTTDTCGAVRVNPEAGELIFFVPPKTGGRV